MLARLYEYGSRGPGARTSATRRVLDAAAARAYTRSNVLGSWNPA
jgi:pectinesterase